MMTSGCMCLTVKILGLWHDPKQIAQKKKNDAINEKAEVINIYLDFRDGIQFK